MKIIKLYRTYKIVLHLKYLPILLFLLIINLSCGTQESKNSSNEKSKNQAIKLTNDLMTLWETGDTLKTKKIFADNCTYEDVANNQTLNGIQGVNRFVSHVHNWGSDIKMKIRNLKVSGDMGYVEWTFTAKQTNPIEGRVLVATNKEIRLRGVTLLKFSNGKIKEAKDYMDVLGFVLQLGSKVELPGGVVLNNE